MSGHRDSLMRRKAAQAASVERAARKRWYITINVRPAPDFIQPWGGVGYRKLAWPKLFKSEAAAWAFAKSMTGNPNKGIWTPSDGRRVVSYALETTYLPKKESPHVEPI